MLRTLALGGCMGEITRRGLNALAPLQRLTALAMVHVPGTHVEDRGLLRLSRRSTPPPGEDTTLNEATLVRFLDRHPVLQDWCALLVCFEDGVYACATAAAAPCS